MVLIFVLKDSLKETLQSFFVRGLTAKALADDAYYCEAAKALKLAAFRAVKDGLRGAKLFVYEEGKVTIEDPTIEDMTHMSECYRYELEYLRKEASKTVKT